MTFYDIADMQRSMSIPLANNGNIQRHISNGIAAARMDPAELLVRCAGGRQIPVMTMGPICIANDLRRQDYGKELIPGYQDGITGVYTPPQSYFVDEAAWEEFDRSFPPKQKRTPGQLV